MTKGSAIVFWLGVACIIVSCSRTPEPAAPPKADGPAKVLQFYASPGLVALGEAVTICYGVENATSVAIEPKVRDLTPSPNRCFSISPEKSTIYKLTARGDANEDSEQLAIQVKAPEAPPPAASDTGSALNLFMASSEEVTKGQPVTLCYGVTDVASVRVDPPVHELNPRSSCFTAAVEKTTTFTLIAVDNQKKEHRRQVTVRVK